MLTLNSTGMQDGMEVDAHNEAEGVWGRYPFFDDNGNELWIPAHELTCKQMLDVAQAIATILSRKCIELDELSFRTTCATT